MYTDKLTEFECFEITDELVEKDYWFPSNWNNYIKCEFENAKKAGFLLYYVHAKFKGESFFFTTFFTKKFVEDSVIVIKDFLKLDALNYARETYDKHMEVINHREVKMDVTFKYEVDQEVVTPFGENGIVTMVGIDGEGIQYCVKTAKTQQWHKEKELATRESIMVG